MVYHDKNSLSQNFIKYPRVVRELIEATTIGNEDVVVEIGPGRGIITVELAKKAKKVIAIEKDTVLGDSLKFKVQSSKVKIINDDFLEYELPREKYKVVANIPFSITAEIVNKLLTAKTIPEEIYLIMQKEAAEKYSGEKGETMSSILTKPWYEVEILGEIDRTSFTQKPQVKIVFTRFVKRERPFILNEDKNEFRNFVTYGFSAWAPTFGEAFKKVFTFSQIKTIEKMYKIAGRKPSEVSFDNWLLVYKTFKRVANEEQKHRILSIFRSG